MLLQGASTLHTTGEAVQMKTPLSAHTGARCTFSLHCLCWWEWVYKPGENDKFNLNFIHIPYNNEIAGTGILTIMLYENYISTFSQIKHHTDFISFFSPGKVWRRIIFLIYFQLLQLHNHKNPTKIKKPLETIIEPQKWTLKLLCYVYYLAQ